MTKALDQVGFNILFFENNVTFVFKVVNQQPFGGARLSGTNDKPGSPGYLLKWTSPLSVKESLVPQTVVKHASML